jgi:ribulose 1,5-bisphosphate synthetase/thiazole synthase
LDLLSSAAEVVLVLVKRQVKTVDQVAAGEGPVVLTAAAELALRDKDLTVVHQL